MNEAFPFLGLTPKEKKKKVTRKLKLNQLETAVSPRGFGIQGIVAPGARYPS